MPLYEYECEACGRRFEMIQRFSDPPLETCVSCGGGPVRKLISSPAIHFKGTGWYVTDYAAKDKARASESGENEKSGESEKKSGDSDKKEAAPSGKEAAPSGEPAKGSSTSSESSSSTGSSDASATSTTKS